MICENCGKEFDPDKVADIFDSEMSFTPMKSEFIKPGFCAECAIDAYNGGNVDGALVTTCSECGKEFDIMYDDAEMKMNYVDYDARHIWDVWDNGPLCGECALRIFEEEDAEEDDDDFY